MTRGEGWVWEKESKYRTSSRKVQRTFKKNQRRVVELVTPSKRKRVRLSKKKENR